MQVITDAIITVEGLYKEFGHGKVHALNGVDAQVRKGEVLVVIGPSGSGKSTFLRCLNLLETPTSGQIIFDGVDICDKKTDINLHRQKMGMVFQQFNLFENMNVMRNLTIAPMKIKGMPQAEAEAKAEELVRRVGLSDKLNAYPSQLSGGQKQRIAIARALASDPDVLLSDEATSALDPMTTQSILALLQDINRRLGITIVIITHEMAVIRQVCNRVTIIDGGKIVEEGTVDEVFTHTRSAAGRRLFGVIKEDNDQEIREAVRVVFDGSTLNDPVLSDFIMKTGMPVNILSADVRRLNGKPYGQMLLALPESYADREKLIHGLREMGLTAEEVHS